MKTNIEKVKKLNELTNVFFTTKHTIVLNPDEKLEGNENLGEDIIYDEAKWKITEELTEYINNLSKQNDLTVEDKILTIYEKLCKDYVYDDNLISYIQKVDDDIYALPDWYGRDIDEEWEKNREQHNRRICFELSRYVAKALEELLKDNNEYDVCIFWNKNLTHYFVGLTCDEYSISIDLDDFFKIKDLTRVKTNLTAKGIEILEDKNDKFKNALERFNEGKEEHAIEKIENEIQNKNSENEKEEATELDKNTEENEDIIFCKKAIEILTKKYNLDSQGVFEYMKEIIDIKIGRENRSKVWKRIDGENRESTRYIRCLVIDIEDKKYLIDVETNEFREFNEKELTEKRTKFVSSKELSRGGFDYYDGT